MRATERCFSERMGVSCVTMSTMSVHTCVEGLGFGFRVRV